LIVASHYHNCYLLIVEKNTFIFLNYVVKSAEKKIDKYSSIFHSDC